MSLPPGPSAPPFWQTARFLTRPLEFFQEQVDTHGPTFTIRLAGLPAGALEVREKLEQLRALERGLVICVADAQERPGQDVNTLADLERVAALLAARGV